MSNRYYDWKFKRIEKNLIEDKGKKLEPMKFRSFIGEDDEYEAIDVYYICYNKLVARPLMKISPNSIPPYHFTIYVNGNFRLREEDGAEKLEEYLKKAYESILPERFLDGLKINVTEEMYFLRVEITIDF